MVKDYNKPTYIDVKRDDVASGKSNRKAIELVKKMLTNERFGVLSTSGNHKSYTSLISFASNDKFTLLAFATPIDTKKFKMIKKNENISILVDSRSKNQNNINDIVAITSLGKARILKKEKEIGNWSKILIDKHSYLDDFINADTTAIVVVEISKYYYVTSFQEVIEWIPE